jgi:hypothetical protein
MGDTVPADVKQQVCGKKVRQVGMQLHKGESKATSKTHMFRPVATYEEALSFLTYVDPPFGMVLTFVDIIMYITARWSLRTRPRWRSRRASTTPLTSLMKGIHDLSLSGWNRMHVAAYYRRPSNI